MEAFQQVSQKVNLPMKFVSIFNDSEHCEWFDAFWSEELAASFQKGELSVPNMERPLLLKT